MPTSTNHINRDKLCELNQYDKECNTVIRRSDRLTTEMVENILDYFHLPQKSTFLIYKNVTIMQ